MHIQSYSMLCIRRTRIIVKSRPTECNDIRAFRMKRISWNGMYKISQTTRIHYSGQRCGRDTIFLDTIARSNDCEIGLPSRWQKWQDNASLRSLKVEESLPSRWRKWQDNRSLKVEESRMHSDGREYHADRVNWQIHTSTSACAIDTTHEQRYIDK